jgi:hypothetical protein
MSLYDTNNDITWEVDHDVGENERISELMMDVIKKDSRSITKIIMQVRGNSDHAMGSDMLMMHDNNNKFNHESIRCFPPGMKYLFSGFEFQGPYQFHDSVDQETSFNPFYANRTVFSKIMMAIMNYGAHVVGRNAPFELKFRYDLHESEEEEDSFKVWHFHRMSKSTFHDMYEECCGSHGENVKLNFVTMACICSEIRNFLEYEVQYNARTHKKESSWFYPRKKGHNPSTLPGYMMNNLFKNTDFPEEGSEDYDEFTNEFYDIFGFEFNNNWFVYRDFIIRDLTSSLANAFFNKYINHVKTDRVRFYYKARQNLEREFLPRISLFESDFSSSNNAKDEERFPARYDDVPFVFLQDLMDISSFGPLPGSVQAFFYVSSYVSSHVFHEHSNISMKDRLPSLITFYRKFLENSYVGQMLTTIISMPSEDFKELNDSTDKSKLDELITNISEGDVVLEPTTGPLEAMDPEHSEAMDPEQALSRIPSGVISVPVSPEPQRAPPPMMNASAPPFQTQPPPLHPPPSFYATFRFRDHHALMDLISKTNSKDVILMSSGLMH